MRGEQYLTKAAQYRLVYEKGSTRVTDLVIMKALPNTLELSRCGFSVSKRVGKATVRNLVKRRLREITRQMTLKAGWDIIFIARPKAAEARFSDLQHSVSNTLSRSGLLTR
ncbi:MAG: ribonuclease P protein component [Dehalococcoidales bacterium]|nr:ribonuclease P protein component [Dehalococcoidales bacterium]